MPASLLRSQIDTLEEPDPSEDSLTIEASAPPDQIAEEIIRRLCAATVVQNTTAFAH
jgi:ribose 5-phosphate isomerase A